MAYFGTEIYNLLVAKNLFGSEKEIYLFSTRPNKWVTLFYIREERIKNIKILIKETI